MALFNQKIMEEFIKQEHFLSSLSEQNPDVNMKTMFYSFIDGDSSMENEYREFSKQIINPKDMK